jgi:hypothetical protein
MAIEVNEIGIRMRVVGDGEPSAGATDRDGGGSSEADRRNEIVEACVRRVLQILRAVEAR